MSEIKGFITLEKTILDHWCSKDPNFLAVWVRLLLEANYKSKTTFFNGAPITVDRGQLIYGREAFSERSNVSVSKLRRIIKILEDENQISQQKTNKYSIISITNYDYYQSNDQQKTSKSPTNDHQTTTSKQSKQYKQKKDTKKTYSLTGDLPDGFVEFRQAYPEKKNTDWSGGLETFVKWMNKGITLEQMLYAINFWNWSDDDMFKPHPSPLLNKQLWKNMSAADKPIAEADKYRLPLENFRDKGIWFDDYGPWPTIDKTVDGPLNDKCKAPMELMKEVLNRGDLI